MSAVFKILVGNDLSEHSDRALDYAIALAERRPTEITVFHAIPEMPISFGQDQDTGVYQQLLDELRARVESHLTAHVDKLKDDTIKVKVGYGDPASALAQEAEALKADLVIVGKPHIDSLYDFFMGSTVQRLARKIHTSLLVAQGRELLPNHRILVPLDLSPLSNLALALGAELCKRTDSKMTLLHAAYSPYTAVYQSMLAGNGPELVQAALDAEKTAFEQVVSTYEDQGVVEGIRFVEGRPAEEILKAAPEFDLVVLASESGSSWTKNLIGSVAERVLEHCPKSVLLVKEVR